MSDSRTRAEDRAAEAEENQRQMLQASDPPTLFKATNIAQEMGKRQAETPEVRTTCGPVEIIGNRVNIGGLHMTPADARRVFDALGALIDAQVLP